MSQPSNNPRWANIYQAMTGVTAPGHHESPVGTSDDSKTAGHEPDKFDAKGIVMVPILVIVVTTLAYFLVSGLFNMIKPGKPYDSPTMSPLAIDESKKSFNDRAARISNVDPKAPVKHPRLEGIVVVDQANERGGSDAVNYRSFPASTKDNTYYLTPQDLYPSKFVDPITGEKLLEEFKPITKSVARIPLEEAMKLLLKNGSLKAMKDGTNPSGTIDAPKQSNGGQSK